jgi:transposase
MSHFRPCDRETLYLLPPSLDDRLPKDHLARFVVDIVDQLDLSALIGRYRGAGSAAYPPAMLLALLLYGYATGTYSSCTSQRHYIHVIPVRAGASSRGPRIKSGAGSTNLWRFAILATAINPHFGSPLPPGEG